jgi:hypothetical protein
MKENIYTSGLYVRLTPLELKRLKVLAKKHENENNKKFTLSSLIRKLANSPIALEAYEQYLQQAERVLEEDEISNNAP